MGDVGGAEGAPFAVFEPFGTHWVATDVEVPDGLGDIHEAITFFVDGNFAVGVFGMRRINDRFAALLNKLSDRSIKGG